MSIKYKRNIHFIIQLSKLKNYIFFLFFLAFFSSCNAQKATKEDTNQPIQLGENIMVVYQDSKNNYWFGSWETGLYKYDGNSITHFTTQDGILSNRIEEIKGDKLGNIYLSTNKGISRYDGKQFNSLNESIFVRNHWALNPNDLWFKNPKPRHVYRYDGKILYSLEIPKTKFGEDYIKQKPSALDPYAVYCNYKDSKGNIWFGTAVLGAFRYDGYSFEWISEPDVSEIHDGPANGVRSIIEDKDGLFWFNANFKYKIFEGSGQANPNNTFYERIKSIGSLDGKKDGKIDEYLSITKDNHNNLWIATYTNGVWKYDGSDVTHYQVQENGKDIHLFYIYKDNFGDIWLGTHESGVWKFNGKSFERFIP